MPEFTASQVDAIDFRRQDACVVAGPGSGKTTVLVERYRTLIVDHRLKTEEILAITFTEKAAANMKSKLAAIFEYNEALRRELEAAWVSTIHGFCSRLLKQNAVAAGVDPRFRVLDERQSDKLQRECLSASVNHLAETRRIETIALIEALHYAELTGPLQTVYDAIRSSGMRVEEVRDLPSPGNSVTVAQVVAATQAMLFCWAATPSPVQRTQQADLAEWISRAPARETLRSVWEWQEACPANLQRCPRDHKDTLRQVRDVMLADLVASAANREYAPFRAMICDVLARFDTLYRDRKTALGALDFNDLERFSVQLLKQRPEVRKRLNEQFRQIMLDEFQDINDQQWQLLELVRGPETFFAVGDINQSIYGFRHARPEIFERYQEQTANKHYAELLENFRSRQEILSCVEALLDGREGIQPRGLHAGKLFPKKTGSFVEVIKAFAEEKTAASELEAQWIAHRLLSMRHRTLIGEPGNVRTAEFSDFAVLVRTGDAMRPILDAFHDANIPFVSSRQDSFLLSREGLDLTALLHVISNPRDEVQLTTVLRSPLVAVSDEALLHLRLTGWNVSEGFQKLETAPLSEDDRTKLQRFSENLRRWRQEQPVLALDLLIVRALSDCGYEWHPDSGEDVESFLRLARTTGLEMSLPEFLDEVDSLCSAIDKEADLSDDDQGDRVQVLTVHAAKGLEFPIVFVAAMDKEGRHGSGAINFTPQHGLGIRWRSPDGSREGIKDGWHASNGDAVKSRENQETNRLLYVAMTRAEEHLILSYSATARKTCEWALIVENRYGLKDQLPSEESFTRTDRAPDGREFEVTIRVAALAPEFSREFWPDRENREVAVLARPMISGQSDSVFSVTALTVFGQCPRKYYLQRYIGAEGGRFRPWAPDSESANEPGEADELPAAELGTQTHALLAGVESEYSEEARRLADVFTRSNLGVQAALTTARREWEFISAIDEVLVRGVIDLWFERGFEHRNETVIVDYKTDDVKPEHVEERAQVYATQLAFYALALKKSPVRAYLHFLQPDVQVEVPLNQAAFERARALLSSLSKAQETFDFPLHEAEHCKRCSYWRGQCPAGHERELLTRISESVPEGIPYSG